MREAKDARLFFALWPDTALRERLDSAAGTIPVEPPTRRVPRANLHMTLHFIGNVWRDEMRCLRQRARRVEATRFRFVVDNTGCFEKPRVGWLGCDETPLALHDLHRQLGEHLRGCGFEPEKRAYNPHVTVLRKTRSVAGGIGFDPIEWSVDSFSLIEVVSGEKGVHYHAVETYPLT